MSDDLSRRAFMAAAASGLSAGTASAFGRRHRRCVPAPCPPQPCPPCPDPQPQPDPRPQPQPDGLRVRPAASSLTPAQVESLRRGVAVLKSLPGTDRRNWTFQANMHWTDDPTNGEALFNQCKHDSPHFLSWHRGYVYYFERILRWASGDPALTLPFWDWTADAYLPDIFRDPAGNPLYEPRRAFNDPALGLTPDVGWAVEDAMAEKTYLPSPAGQGFNTLLEVPHGLVHTQVGGPGGLMARVPTAARDPIFWLHHANVDRLWDVWLARGEGRTHPTDPGFLRTPFTYVDEDGNPVTRAVADILSSAGLGYRYDGVPPVPAQFVAAAGPPAGAAPAVVATSAAPADRGKPAAEVKPTRLGFEEVEIDLGPVGGGPRAVAPQGAGAAGPADRLEATIEGISAEKVPNVSYAVYVDLPKGARSPEVLRAHYVGSIDFFGKADHQGQGGHAGHGGAGRAAGFDQTFDLTRALARVRESGRAAGASKLTVLPFLPEPKGRPGGQVEVRTAAGVKTPEVTFRRVTVRAVPAR